MIGPDLARLFVAATLLAFASWTDWMWRRAPNVLWVILGGAGLIILGVEAALDWDRMVGLWPYLVAAPALALFFFAAWWIGLIAGGADAKALMALAFLLPFPLDIGPLPLIQSVMPGSVALLSDSLIAVLVIPVYFLVRNTFAGDFGLRMFLGRRVPLDTLVDRQAWPMERVVDGKVKTSWFPSRSEAPLDETVTALREAGVERVWITPKIPFMIPMLIGLVVAYTLGDLLMGSLKLILGPI